MAADRKPGEERLTKSFRELCEEAKTRIRETTPEEVEARIEDPNRDWLLIDVREQDDVVQKLEKTATYTFQVTRAWKGVAKGSVVEVQRNTYWGDGFAMGQPYLVFGTHRKEGSPLTAELCGPTVPLQYAEPYKQVLAQYYEGRPKLETALPDAPDAAPGQ